MVIDLNAADRPPVATHDTWDSTWLPAALLATLTLLAGALQALGGEQDLQWQRARMPQRISLASSAPRPVRHVLTDQRDSRGYAVVQVVYTEDAMAWNAGSAELPTGAASVSSIVMHPGEFGDQASEAVYETAQSPFGNDDLDTQLGRDIVAPFGADDLVEPIPDAPGGLDELPEPDEMPESALPDDEPDDGTTAQPDDRFDRQPPPTPTRIDPLPRQPDTTFRDLPDATDVEPADDQADRELTDTERKRMEQERTAAQETCAEELRELKASRIASIDLSIAQTGEEGRDYPFECNIDDGSIYQDRAWPEVTYMWKAAGNCHKPLYFEEVQLERYGHTCGPILQPIVSGAHFFATIPVLPYKMGLTSPCECIYPLGYYRPGDCAPYMVGGIPFTWRAALFQAGATVGTAAILP